MKLVSGEGSAYDQLWPIICTTVQSLQFLASRALRIHLTIIHTFTIIEYVIIRTFKILQSFTILPTFTITIIGTFSQDFSDFQPSLFRLQSHISKHSEHKLYESLPRCDILCTTSCQDRRYLFELCTNTFHSSSSCLLHTTTGTKYICHPDDTILVHTPPSHLAQT